MYVILCVPRSVLPFVALVVGGTAGVSGANTTKATPTVTSVLSKAHISPGETDIDTATVTGKAAYGSPTGSVTFGVCGPTAATKVHLAERRVGHRRRQRGIQQPSHRQSDLRPRGPRGGTASGTSTAATATTRRRPITTTTECVDVTKGGGGATPTIARRSTPPRPPPGSASGHRHHDRERAHGAPHR